ncbi:MAG: hypothetical protein AB8G86_27390 [Saprospiraceae bacterium]
MELLKHITQLSTYRPEGGLKKELYQLVVEENYNRTQAKRHFEDKQYKSNFRVVYKNLKDSLLDGVITTPLHKLPNLIRSRLQVWKKQLQYRIFIQIGDKEAGIKLATETLIAAEQNEQFEVVHTICRDLLSYYSTSHPNTQKYQKYRQKYTKVTKLMFEEAKAEIIYRDFLYNYHSKQPITSFSLDIAELETIALSNDKYKFRYYFYALKSLYLKLIKDSDALLVHNKIAYTFFNQLGKDLHYVVKLNFIAGSIPYYILKNQFPATEHAINLALSVAPKHSFDWQRILIYQSILGFYSQKPKIALRAFNLSKQVPSKKNTSEVLFDKWYLIEGYLAFFGAIGRIPPMESFRLSRWLNITERRNKPAQKANLIIIELLYHLATKNHAKYFRKTEQIESYINTHFKAHTYKRTRYFLRMLKAVVKGNYHHDLVPIYAAKQLTKLRAAQSELNSEVIELEIIPYELLWEEVLLRLKR